jgi:2-oxoglutarate dehydrogenase complex dehydrogenase (E1) component-like enzyme
MDLKLEYVGRPPSASSAAGYFEIHRQQRQALIAEALQIN